MKLRQGQVWKVNQEYVRIVAVERLAVDYKTLKHPDTKAGVHGRSTKKQFCTFLKTATLVSPVPSDETKSPVPSITVDASRSSTGAVRKSPPHKLPPK